MGVSNRKDKGRRIESSPLQINQAAEITGYQNSEEALRLSEIKFRAMADYAYDWEYWTQPEGGLEYISPSCERVTGYRREDFIKDPDLLMKIIHPDDRSRVQNHIEKEPENAASIDYRIITRNGEIRWIAHACQPIYTQEGQWLGQRVSNRDITGRKMAEESLRKSEEQLRVIFENSTVGKSITLLDGTLIKVNPAFADMLGYTISELQQFKFFQFTHPDDIPVSQECVRSLLAGERPTYRFEKRYIHKNGSIIWADVSTTLIKNTAGEPLYFVTSTLNITERKKTEEALKESEERFRGYFQLGLVGMAIESPSGDWIEVNDRLCEIYGYSREELMQLHWKDLTHPDDLEKDIDLFQQLVTGKINHYSMEKRFIRKDGEIIYAFISLGCVRGPGGEALEIFGLLDDITEMRKATLALIDAKKELETRVKERTRELAESEEKYRLVVENANEAVVVVQDEKLRFFNQKAVELSGYSREELESISFVNILHPDDRKPALQYQQTLLQSINAPFNYDIRIVTKEETLKWVSVNAAILQWRGKPAIIGLITDITQKKNLEQELKAYARRITQVQEEERKKIAYELHDDTAQYLALVKLELDSLLTSGKIQDPQIIEKLKFLEKDAARASDDVRRYSHELRPGVLEHLGLQAAIEQIAEDQNKVGQIQVEVKVKGSEPKIPEDVKLGFFRIAQEAINNCRKHAKVPQAYIDLEFIDNQIKMMVSDKGVGFEATQTYSRIGEAGSLGLMSMQERAKLIGADLKIESKPGQGTKVILKIVDFGIQPVSN